MMNDEMGMDETPNDSTDEPQVIDLTDAAEITSDDSDDAAVPVVNPWSLPGQWFVVHSQAGYEKKVKANLEARIQSLNMEDRIFDIVIPMEDVTEFKNGRKQTVQKKVFPGYLWCVATWTMRVGIASVTRLVLPVSLGRAKRVKSQHRWRGVKLRRSCRQRVMGKKPPIVASRKWNTKWARAFE